MELVIFLQMPVRSRRRRPSRIFRHRRRRHQRRRRRRVRRRPSAASAVGAAIDGGHLLQRAARQDKASGELPIWPSRFILSLLALI